MRTKQDERDTMGERASDSRLPEDLQSSLLARAFWRLTAAPRLLILIGLVTLVLAALPIRQLVKDTRADAFLPADHPSLELRAETREVFGLGDSVAVAVVAPPGQSILGEEVLPVLEGAVLALEETPGVDPERIVSLLTEDTVRSGEDGALEIEPLEIPDVWGAGVEAELQDRVAQMGAWQGTLISRDGSAALAVAELLDGADGAAVYDEVLRRTAEIQAADGIEIHVAGDGAVRGFMSRYIDQDAQRLIPLSLLLVAVVLWVTLRTARGVFLPLLLTAATVASAVGVMAGLDVPFFLITNGMVVVLIGVSVADGIHLLSQYNEELARRPQACSRELTVRALLAQWRPIALTSVTDAAGFAALALAAFMPPMRWFGAFAALGVMVALSYCFLVLPGWLVVLAPRAPAASAFGRLGRSRGGGGVFSTAVLTVLANRVIRHPKLVLVVAALVALVGGFGATRLQLDEEMVRYFHPREQVRLADEAINERLDGTHYVDVLIETPELEGLLEPDAVQRVAELEGFLLAQPEVRGVDSLLGVLRQLHRSLEPEQAALAGGGLPQSSEMLAQSLLLYEMSAGDRALGRYVDGDYQRTLLRAQLGTSRLSRVTPLVEDLQQRLEGFEADGWRAEVTGRVEVNYQWMRELRRTHFRTLAVALAVVWFVAVLGLRSWSLGTLAVIPVCLAVLAVYAVMASVGIWLAIGTTMFAAIAIGTSVDFAIHTIVRLRQEIEWGADLEHAVRHYFLTTGRALLYNAAAMVIGFSALTLSKVPSLVQFGSLVAVAVAISFVASVTVLPAVALALRPAALTAGGRDTRAVAGDEPLPRAAAATVTAGAGVLLIGALVGAGLLSSGPARAAEIGGVEQLSGEEVVRRINTRDDGDRVRRVLEMTLRSRPGSEKKRTATVLREDGADGVRRQVLVYSEPSRVRDTGLLTWDHEEQADDQWLYLPATRRVRRISAAGRGDRFLGTDFTFEEMKNGTRVSADDHYWRVVGTSSDEQALCRDCLVVEGTPRTPALQRELGYGRLEVWVDADLWIVRRSDYWDVKGNAQRRVLALEIEDVGGILTPRRYEATDLKTEHVSIIEVASVDYPNDIADELFTQQALSRGLR